MKHIQRFHFTAAVLVVCMASVLAVQGQTYSVLYTFMGGADGSYPNTLSLDASGNLYGAGGAGGDLSCNAPFGCGVVFKLDTSGVETVLHTFGLGMDDGKFPTSAFRHTAGVIYGTTSEGGTYDLGTVFKLDTNTVGEETVLWSFGGSGDGAQPSAGVIRDARGNLYGTTGLGGTYSQGTVFKLDSTGNETVLHSFTGGLEGDTPVAALVTGSAGQLYGTALGGGSRNQGTVFILDDRTRKIAAYGFKGAPDGGGPDAALIWDSGHKFLYGTTDVGGAYNLGTVFRMDTAEKVTVLHSFAGGTSDGADPEAGLTLDAAGNLYGTTYYGGPGPCSFYGVGCGTVFKLDTSGRLTMLHSFFGGADGRFPVAGVILDEQGNLYGTTSEGGSRACQSFGIWGCGVVFKITP